MSPSVVGPPEWITTSSGIVPAGTIAAVAFPPGAGNAGGVDMAILQRQNTEKATTDHLWRYG